MPDPIVFSTTSKIDLKKVNVSIGNQDLIVDSHLKLKAGVHYAVGAFIYFSATCYFSLRHDDLFLFLARWTEWRRKIRLVFSEPALSPVSPNILRSHFCQSSFELLRTN